MDAIETARAPKLAPTYTLPITGRNKELIRELFEAAGLGDMPTGNRLHISLNGAGMTDDFLRLRVKLKGRMTVSRWVCDAIREKLERESDAAG